MIILGLGSNLHSSFGDKFKNIELATQYLESFQIKILTKSSFYETPSYPDNKNPKFINESINPLNLYKNIESEKIPIINLNNISWNEYYEKISNSKTRQTDRRKEKLLSQKGDLKFIVADKLNDREEILDFTLKNKVLFLQKALHLLLCI